MKAKSDKMCEEVKEENKDNIEAASGKSNGEGFVLNEKNEKNEKNELYEKNEKNENSSKHLGTQKLTKEYKKLKYKDIIYKIGDTIIVKDTKSPELVCKLMKIIPKNGNPLKPYWPMIEVIWYYKKQDIDFISNQVSNGFQDCIADNELFETNHKEKIFADCILDHCRILSFEEYDGVANLKQNDFFCRSFYDIRKKIINPPISTWEKVCVCKKPINPNILFVICDKCDRFFHPSCMGLNEKELDSIPNFFCSTEECEKVMRENQKKEIIS